MRRLHAIPGRSAAAVWLLLASLLFGQLGFGTTALVVWTAAADGCGAPECPCDARAGAGQADQDDRDDGPAPARDTDDRCPPGCDEAGCCPGALRAIVGTAMVLLRTPRRDAAPVFLPHDPLSATGGRLFRPPERLLV